MKKDLKVKIIDVFGAVSSLAVIFFFFTLWLFSYNSVEEPLKEAWSSSISFLSVPATLGAAFIAAHLYDDWKEIHNYTSLKDFALKVFYISTEINVRLTAINDIFSKSLKAHKIGPNTYNIAKIADDVEAEMGGICDLFSELLHQINFFQILNNDDDIILHEMHNLLLDYIDVMDITNYRKITCHYDFAIKESELKLKWDNLRNCFNNYLKKYVVIESTLKD